MTPDQLTAPEVRLDSHVPTPTVSSANCIRSRIWRSDSSLCFSRRRSDDSRSSRSMAGTSRVIRSFTTKSRAPARSTSTADSSATVPEMTMHGSSGRRRPAAASTSWAVMVGSEKSLIRMSHDECCSASRSADSVSTRPCVTS